MAVNADTKTPTVNDKKPGEVTSPLSLDNYPNKLAYLDQKKLENIAFSNLLVPRDKIRWYDYFKRLPTLDPYNAVTTTKEYLFFTKPDLNIFASTSYDLNPQLKVIPIFADANSPARYRRVMLQLQSSMWGNGTSPFINILSNSCTSSLDLPGIDADDIQTAANTNGVRLNYRLTSLNSDNDFTFNLEFEDTKYLEVYMLFKLYDEYERLKHQGRVAPNKKYITNKILHDQISIYKFIVDADGETLLYWAKLFGCYPKGVPRDALSNMDNSGGLKFSIPWRCQFVEDMDPLILSDFNYLVADQIGYKKPLPMYNNTMHEVEYRWPSLPYIEKANPENANPGKGIIARPRLKWVL